MPYGCEMISGSDQGFSAGRDMSAALQPTTDCSEAVLDDPWRDLPERTGRSCTSASAAGRRAAFSTVFQALASDHDNEYMMIDATIVRAHHIVRAREKKRQAIGRSRGGLTTKIHALVDANPHRDAVTAKRTIWPMQSRAGKY